MPLGLFPGFLLLLEEEEPMDLLWFDRSRYGDRDRAGEEERDRDGDLDGVSAGKGSDGGEGGMIGCAAESSRKVETAESRFHL